MQQLRTKLKRNKSSRPGQRGKEEVNTLNVVPHDIPRPIPRRKTPFVLKDRRMSFHTTFQFIPRHFPRSWTPKNLGRVQCRSPRHSQRRIFRSTRHFSEISINKRFQQRMREEIGSHFIFFPFYCSLTEGALPISNCKLASTSNFNLDFNSNSNCNCNSNFVC